MNCGALCAGLSNNDSLENLTVYNSDARGMIAILKLNATKKSLRGLSLAVFIFNSSFLSLSINPPKQQASYSDKDWENEHEIADYLKNNDSLTQLRLVSHTRLP